MATTSTATWRTTAAGGGQDGNNGPRAKCDQVVFEAIAKAAEIVVGSRCWIDGGNFGNGGGGGGVVGGSNHNNNNSSRFNLLVPEVQGVRSILQRWKRALHVPLRLDVYYQHKDSRRELLERWCLEYAPKAIHHATTTTSNNKNNNNNAFFYDDPIVQLRQVCKQIVVWLRTLYCWSRMLPAQALRQRHNNPIGFSIYVVSEGNDDVSGLVENQGFQSQGQPHGVTTPYGELGWKVFYAPKNPMIQRLLPEKVPYAAANTKKSQPIPMQQQQQQSPAASNHKHLLQRRESSSPTTTARSAPHANGRMYRRANSATPDMISDGSGNHHHHHHHQGMATSFRTTMRSNSGLPSFVQQQQHQQQQQQFQQGPPSADHGTVPLSTSADGKPPTKSMSGLSLAMMQSDENIDDDDDTTTTANNNNTNNNNNNKDPKEESTAEKRRAALHHAPPQFGSPVASSPVLKKSLASAGEYGYAYNNHIPIPNSNRLVAPVAASDDPLLHSPRSSTPTTPLASTPPGYLYGGPTPPAMVPSNLLIPPRTAVTPPFVRPMGFVGEAPSQPMPPPDGAADGSTATGALQQQQQQPPHNALIPNLQASHHASLDLLHSSPFQQLPHHHGSSALSSVLPPTSNNMHSFADYHHHHHHPYDAAADHHHHHGSHFDEAGLFHHPFPHHHHQQDIFNNTDEDDDDDMPFAVDAAEPITGGGAGGAGTSTTIGGSISSTSMIAVPAKKKLALFDKGANSQHLQQHDQHQQQHQQQSSTTLSVASLADQLAEFKSFGASLNLGSAVAGG